MLILRFYFLLTYIVKNKTLCTIYKWVTWRCLLKMDLYREVYGPPTPLLTHLLLFVHNHLVMMTLVESRSSIRPTYPSTLSFWIITLISISLSLLTEKVIPMIPCCLAILVISPISFSYINFPMPPLRCSCTTPKFSITATTPGTSEIAYKQT